MTSVSSISTQGANYFQLNTVGKLNQQLQQVMQEVSTGEKANNFGQLGTQANLSLSLHSEDDLINAYSDAINNVTVRTDSMDSSMTDINSQLSKVLAQMATVSQGSNGTPDLTQLQTLATQALQSIQQDLNSNVDNKYLFGGAMNDASPIQDTTAINTNVSAQLANYGTLSASTIISNVNGLTEAQLGYNANLAAAPDATVRADNNIDVNYTVKADEDPYKQMMIGLSEIANMPAYDANNSTDYWSLFNDAKARITGGQDDNNTRQGQLGVARSQLSGLLTTHSTAQTTIESNLSGIEAADMGSASTQLQSLQTQLQATYSVIGRLSNLSLLNYLPTA